MDSPLCKDFGITLVSLAGVTSWHSIFRIIIHGHCLALEFLKNIDYIDNQMATNHLRRTEMRT